MNDNKWVAPGTLLGTEEEYVAGKGTYVENSKIYASILGRLEDDKRTLNVICESLIMPVPVNAIIVGRVEAIIDPIAIVSVQQIESQGKCRFVISGENFVLKVQNIRQGYVKNVKDEIRIGDIIRAKVIDIKNGEYHITTEDPNLGCIRAYCSNPRSRFILTKTNTGLVCEQNGTKENRKVASDYLPAK
jgi:exosome complex component CSL4